MTVPVVCRLAVVVSVGHMMEPAVDVDKDLPAVVHSHSLAVPAVAANRHEMAVAAARRRLLAAVVAACMTGLPVVACNAVPAGRLRTNGFAVAVAVEHVFVC